MYGLEQTFTNTKRGIDIFKHCTNHDGLLPLCDPTHMLRRARTYVLNHNSVIDHSSKSVEKQDIINADLFKNIAGITH